MKVQPTTLKKQRFGKTTAKKSDHEVVLLFSRKAALLSNFSMVAMKELLRTAGLPIPKTKDQMIDRLTLSSRVVLTKETHLTATATKPKNV